MVPDPEVGSQTAADQDHGYEGDQSVKQPGAVRPRRRVSGRSGVSVGGGNWSGKESRDLRRRLSAGDLRVPDKVVGGEEPARRIGG